MFRPNRYRSHGCGELRAQHAGETVRISGWIHRKRDLGGMLFLLLRDHSGLVQVRADPGTPAHAALEPLRLESVVQVEGEVTDRGKDANDEMPTGAVEVVASGIEVHSSAEVLPFQVATDDGVGETERLKHRFLDLRRERLQHNLKLRAQVIASIRRRMTEMDFLEYQTPILTSSSPEGARDYLVPSRLYPGKFYALPQAPQQFKQLIMVSGFPRYFQIAPCFRDEDARADRSPGEFYQMDMEMAYVEQDDVFTVIENLFEGLFAEFSDWDRNPAPYPRITYADSMRRFGNDKPDLRFGVEIQDVTEAFRTSEFKAFRGVVEEGGVVRALAVPGAAAQSRKFFDGLDKFVKGAGGFGCAWISFPAGADPKGSIAKFLGEGEFSALRELEGSGEGASCLLIAGKDENEVSVLAGKLRVEVAQQMELIPDKCFRFCWIVDYPMFEEDEETGQVEFSHNPFSMPQGGLEALETQDPLDILAYQYDIVCNGIELSSGAIRNHRPDIMYKAFEIAGHGPEVVDEKFGGMIRAFKFGAPPHGGIAPGVDRIVMLLADEPNIREVIMFPMNQRAEDLLMGAPAEVRDEQLDELHLRVQLPK